MNMNENLNISCDGPNTRDAFRAVRKRAEKILNELAPDLNPTANTDLQELIHEIDNRRAELESRGQTYRRAQEELAQLRNRYDDLYDSIPVGLVALTSKGIVARANRSAEQLLALPAEVLIDKGFSRWIHAKDHRLYFSSLRKAVDSGLRQTCNVRLLGKDKRFLNVRIETAPHFDEARNLTEWILTLSDMPDRKQAEQALQQKVRQLRDMLNSVVAMIGLMSPDGTLIEVNHAALEASDLKSDDVLGKPMEDCYWWSWSPEVQKRLCEAIELAAAGQGSRYEERIRIGEGELKNVDFKLAPLFGAEGHVTYLIASVTGMTALVGTGSAQAEEDRRFKSIREYTTEAIVTLDMEQRCLEANSVAGFITGISHQQMAGRFLHEFVDASFDLSSAWQNLLKTGRFRGEVPIRHSSGAVRIVEAACYANIEPDRHLFLAHDISEHKRVEAALRDQNASLKQQAAELTESAEARALQLRSLVSELTFAEQRERQRLSEVLHDQLQQLLVGAKINCEDLAAGIESEHKQIAETVLALINRSIQTSRSLTAELSPPPLKQGRLSAMLEWLARSIQEQQGLTVQLQTDPSMDPQREDVTVFLFESVRELLLNVAKHAKVKSASVEMFRHPENRLRVAVIDQGAGFEPEIIAQKARAGAGYGLHRIRRRLELMGGKLELQSSPGKGASIALTLPLEMTLNETEDSSAERDGFADGMPEPQAPEEPSDRFISICGFCKRVRDDTGRWVKIESYITDSFGIEFTHGICPECTRKNYPDYYE